MDKKNIDQLFKERFKDFKKAPDDHVWGAIEASLDAKKKRRRIIPIWWKLGGVAALLAVLLYLFGNFNSEGDKPSPTIEPQEIIVNTPVEDNTKSKDLPPKITPFVKEDNTLTSKDDIKQNTKPQVADRASNEIDSGFSPTTTKSETTSVLAIVDKSATIKNSISTDTTVGAREAGSLETDERVAANSTNTVVDSITNSTIRAAVKTNQSENAEANDGIAQNKVEDRMEKKSIYDVIQEQENDDLVAETPVNRWAVGPTVAPVFFNSFGDGSPVHSSFVPNAKSGNTNVSYGVNVAYTIGKKLKVRSGVHRVEFGLTTNDIAFSASLSGSTNAIIDNITYNNSARNLVVQSKAAVQVPNSAQLQNAISDVFGASATLNGVMVQQFGYLEVPLELNYTLLDRKIGVHVVGGVSSLFLLNNSISLESDGFVTDIGEANNINALNFSTNIGFGVNYKFSKKMIFNIEPVFKYQLNTFTDTAGTFQPYSIGVYSGLNFRF